MRRCSAAARVVWLLLSAWLPAAPLGAQSLLLHRGTYAILESPSEGDVAWAGRFDLVEAGGVVDPTDPGVMARLREAGVTTILAYDWLPAGYHMLDGEPDDPFMAWVYADRNTRSLNPDGPFPHCAEEGYSWCEDYYYDLGLDELVARRVQFLLDFARDHGYDGLFFDWGNGRFLDEPPYAGMAATWRSRHPGTPYSTAVAGFYASLKDAGLTVQANQAFRDAGAGTLQHLDWDMTESWVTDWAFSGRVVPVENLGPVEIPETLYYPLSTDPVHGDLADTFAWLDEMESTLQQYAGPGFRGMVFMSYAAPDFVPVPGGDGAVSRPEVPRSAIFLSLAVPALIGQPAYTQTTVSLGHGEYPAPDRSALSQDPVYFLDLGRPLGEGAESLGDGETPARVRFYEGGFVLAGQWNAPTELTLSSPWIPDDVPLYDAFEHRWGRTGDGRVRIELTPRPISSFDPAMAPSGRIYAYGAQDLTLQCPATVPAGRDVTCRASLTGGANARCLWSFDDGSTDAGLEVHHVFQRPGSATVTVTVAGAEPPLTASTTITVGPPPARRPAGRTVQAATAPRHGAPAEPRP